MLSGRTKLNEEKFSKVTLGTHAIRTAAPHVTDTCRMQAQGERAYQGRSSAIRLRAATVPARVLLQ